MGWNIAGFAINKNYRDSMSELSLALFKSGKYNLVEGRNKYTFEKSSTFGSTKGRMDFMFTEQGSFAFCNVMETEYLLGSINSKLFEGTEMILFAMSETSMAFMMKYYTDGIKIRELHNIEGKANYSFGSQMEIEQQEEDLSELFFKLVSKLIGKEFYSIEAEEPFTRYIKTKIESSK